MRLPTHYIPHGGGPCFFMDWRMGPPDTWDRLAAYLRGLLKTLPERPKAILLVSAHWEATQPTVQVGARPPLIFDYYGFPQHTYELKWPAPGSPELSERIFGLLKGAGLNPARSDRGFDHGVFVPLLLTVPDASIPTVQLSLHHDLDADYHLKLGRALAPLRDEGVWIVGSGMSYHNMRGFMQPRSMAASKQFDGWLKDAIEKPGAPRAEQLAQWQSQPLARAVHPREEHLLPLMVVAGAAEEPGHIEHTDEVMGVEVLAARFG